VADNNTENSVMEEVSLYSYCIQTLIVSLNKGH